MGYDEFHKEALAGRGSALVSKRFALKMKADAIVKRDEIERLLFGDGANHGIVSVIQAYYRLIMLGTGKASNTPAMADLTTAKSKFKTEFAKSVTVPGDGNGGLHPPEPDNPDIGIEKVDPNSVWLTTFSLESSPSGTGIAQRLDNLLVQIGVEASENGNNRGTYATMPLAEAAVASSKGSGLLGLRTENSEIVTVAGATPSYTIGKNGMDNPDTFSTKTSFMKTIDDLVSSIQAWIKQSETIKTMLNGDNAGILSEYKIVLPESDLDALNSSVDQANGFIEELKGYREYFEYFTATGASVRQEFNDQLKELKSYTQTVRNVVSHRCEAIPALMGNADDGMRKHLAFWVSELVKKPDGPYIMLAMAENMIATATEKIPEANKRLSYFGQDRGQWMETPESVTVYDNPVLNLDKTVKEQQVDISWDPVNPANKYLILIKKVPTSPQDINNEPWDIAGGIWAGEANDVTGFAKNSLTVEYPDGPILVRVASYDTNEGDAGDLDRMDTENSHSQQSDVISEDIPFTQLENLDGMTVLSVDPSQGMKEMQYLCLDTAIAQIFSISEDKILLDSDYGRVSGLRKIFGMFCPLKFDPVVIEN